MYGVARQERSCQPWYDKSNKRLTFSSHGDGVTREDLIEAGRGREGDGGGVVEGRRRREG